jgi:hypothetical protein
MAVLDITPGIEVTICSGGQALPEYENNDTKAEQVNSSAYKTYRTVSRYVESVTGQEFSVNMSLSPRFNFDCPTIAFRVHVDGVEVFTNLAFNHEYAHMARHWHGIVAGIMSNELDPQKCSLQRFKFAGLNLSMSPHLITWLC